MSHPPGLPWPHSFWVPCTWRQYQAFTVSLMGFLLVTLCQATYPLRLGLRITYSWKPLWLHKRKWLDLSAVPRLGLFRTSTCYMESSECFPCLIPSPTVSGKHICLGCSCFPHDQHRDWLAIGVLRMWTERKLELKASFWAVQMGQDGASLWKVGG